MKIAICISENRRVHFPKDRNQKKKMNKRGRGERGKERTTKKIFSKSDDNSLSSASTDTEQNSTGTSSKVIFFMQVYKKCRL